MTFRISRRMGGGVALLVALALSVALPAQAATATTAATAAHKTVTYLGHTFTVPSSWPVINLAQHPATCVRFDKHAVYLGAPGANQDCPAQAIGHTDALLIEPASAKAASSATDNIVRHQITATAKGISVTATYATTPTQVTDIITAGGLPKPTTAMKPAFSAKSAVSAATASVASSTTNYTGLAFDPCSAPSASVMSTWESDSPYGAIGIYIGGVNRGCSQPNLTASWVSTLAAEGWHFYLLYVGPQDPDVTGDCATDCTLMTSPSSDAESAAEDAASDAADLGFGAGTPIIYDMESFSSGGDSDAITFISEWTTELHALSYESGEYSSASTGIADLVNNLGSYTPPDVIDIADWNGVESTSDSYVPALDWGNHQRIHQYAGDLTATYGGDTIDIDADYMDIVSGAPATSPSITTLSSGVAEIAFQAAGSGNLWYYNTSTDVGTDTNLDVMSGTSPSITTLSSGVAEIAFQAAGSGNLWYYNTSTDVGTDTNLDVMSGTSPSITTLSSGVAEIAFQAAGSGNLWYYNTSTDVGTDTNLDVMSGTSPSITTLSSGVAEIAFQAAGSGNLWYYDVATGVGTDTNLGVMSGTSPSITTLSSGVAEIAFQAAGSGNLWYYNTSTDVGTDTNLDVMSGTSPSITTLSSGVTEIAFQAAGSGNLWYYDVATGVGTDTNLGVMSGGTPAVTTLSSGVAEIAFQAAGSGNLWDYDVATGVGTDTNLGV